MSWCSSNGKKSTRSSPETSRSSSYRTFARRTDKRWNNSRGLRIFRLDLHNSILQSKFQLLHVVSKYLLLPIVRYGPTDTPLFQGLIHDPPGLGNHPNVTRNASTTERSPSYKRLLSDGDEVSRQIRKYGG